MPKAIRSAHSTALADVGAKGKRNEDQRDLIAVAYRRKGLFADELACDQTVRDVV